MMVQMVDLMAERKPRRDPSERWRDLPKTFVVIAFDPGGTTGWSLMEVHPTVFTRRDKILDNLLIHQHGEVDCGSKRGNLGLSGHDGISTSGEAAGTNALIRLCKAWPGAAIVIEDFILLQERKDRDLLSPVRITAAISYSLWLQGREYTVQSPAMAKTVATDARLKDWGLYDRHGGLGHARDADRHAITFLRRAVGSADLRQRAWPHLFSPGRPYGPPRSDLLARKPREAPPERLITLDTI